MQILHQCCCGLDVHKRFVVACLIRLGEDGKQHKELRRFDTLTPDLLRLIDWLQAASCTHVGLESTGVYWKPIFNLMEGLFEIVLVNAQHMKAVPGRKTDTKDAEWIADLLQHGLLKASFIPPQPQRDLRDLTRYRTSLKQERTQHVNRIHKLLEETNIKLSSIFGDLMCKTGRVILQALAAGETNPEVLADLTLLRAPQKREALVPALQGCMRAHHRFLLQELLAMVETLERAIGRLDREIEERLAPHQEMLSRLDEITGVSQRVLETLFAEVGWELDSFPDAAHLASWVGICPGQKESGGKQISGRTRKGNRYAKTILVQAAHAAGKTKHTYLGAQYRRLSKGRGIKRAAVAVGHSILVIYYHMLTTSRSYEEKGEDYFIHHDQQEKQRRLVKQLERLGYTVHLTQERTI
jgi:transposase